MATHPPYTSCWQMKSSLMKLGHSNYQEKLWWDRRKLCLRMWMLFLYFGFLVCSQGQLLLICFEIKILIVSSGNKHSERMHQSRCGLCKSMGSLLAIWSYCRCLLYLGSRLGGAPTISFGRQKRQQFRNALFRKYSLRKGLWNVKPHLWLGGQAFPKWKV